MICKFKVNWIQNGKIDNSYTESGYVAGENLDDCFRKIREWYFGDDLYEVGDIAISAVPWTDDSCDIVMTESIKPENLTVTYDPPAESSVSPKNSDY